MKKLLLISLLTITILSCKKGTEPEEVKDENVEFEEYKEKYLIPSARDIVWFSDNYRIDTVKSTRIDTTFPYPLYDPLVMEYEYLYINSIQTFDSLAKEPKVNKFGYGNYANLLTGIIREERIDSVRKLMEKYNKSLVILLYYSVGISKQNKDRSFPNLYDKITFIKIGNKLYLDVVERENKIFRGVSYGPILYILAIDNKYSNCELVFKRRVNFYEDK